MISLIWAQDEDRGIAKAGKIPWFIRGDLYHFKQTTTGKVVVMGRTTFQTLGNRPLVDRTNVVLTRDPNFVPPHGVVVCRSVSEVLDRYHDQDVMVIGGKQIYDQFFPHANELIISKIPGHHGCDLILNYDLQHFQLVHQSQFPGFAVELWEKRS